MLELKEIAIGDQYTGYSKLIHEVLNIQGDVIRCSVVDHSGKKVIYRTNRKDFLKYKTKYIPIIK